MIEAVVVGVLLLVVGGAFRTASKKLSETGSEVRALRQRLQELQDRLDLTDMATTTLTTNVAELRFPEFEPYAYFMSVYPTPDRTGPYYLPLLHLTEAGCVEAVYNVQATHNRDDINQAIIGLLAKPYRKRQRLSWEPHLVGAVALIANREAGPCPDDLLELLWTRVQDSWVSPQLLVAASLVDPSFDDRARALVPENVHPKTLTALLALLSDREEAERLAQESWVSEAIARDRDGGAAIATGWRSAILEMVDDARSGGSSAHLGWANSTGGRRLLR